MTTFVDRVVLHLEGGRGGNGCASIRREKFKPLGGPDGGNGGNGGDVVLVVSADQSTLLDYHHTRTRHAGHGSPGRGDDRAGASGADLVLPVPDGTVVATRDAAVLADLVGEGTRFVVAAGGRGGLGNAALASPRRKAPGFALLGEPGQAVDVVLELKTVADVGLVGLPSAGKSSLVAAMSAARPKIADYPFTTLVPTLGVVDAGQTRFTVADVPGLIAGASQGRGLGLRFLRHIERCAVLVHVLDCATLEPGRDPITDLETIERELATYQDLSDRQRVVALNKVDVPEARELAELVTPMLRERGLPVFAVSAVSREGLRTLTYALAEHVHRVRASRPAAQPQRIVLHPRAVDDEGFSVTQEVTVDGAPRFRVLGSRLSRWVRQTDFGNDEAVGYLADRFARAGVEEELLRQGAAPGDTVVVGADDDAVVFDFAPDVAAGAELLPGPRGSDRRLDAWEPER